VRDLRAKGLLAKLEQQFAAMTDSDVETIPDHMLKRVLPDGSAAARDEVRSVVIAMTRNPLLAYETLGPGHHARPLLCPSWDRMRAMGRGERARRPYLPRCLAPEPERRAILLDHAKVQLIQEARVWAAYTRVTVGRA
jgi:hypothetical protein